MKKEIALSLSAIAVAGLATAFLLVPGDLENAVLPGQHIRHFLSKVDAAKVSGEPVKVVFYGQSITKQAWSMQLQERLRSRFPQVRFEFQNLAVGGHTAGMLVRLVEADVLPLNPDLVIFHVYGDSTNYEKIIRILRTGSAADVVIATNHLVNDTEVTEEARRARLFESGLIRKALSVIGLVGRDSTFQGWWNSLFLPRLARQYGLELVDVRLAWKQELASTGREARYYLSDQVHLNTQGEDLMARIFVSSFDRMQHTQTQRPRVDEKAWRTTVKVPVTEEHACTPTPLGKGYLVQIAGASQGDVTVRVNGKNPETDPHTFWTTRVSHVSGSEWPGLLHVHPLGADVRPDEWSVRILEKTASGNRFQVYSRQFGDEGSGDSGQEFTARSGRIRLKPEDWNLEYALAVFPGARVENTTLEWSTMHLGQAVVPALRVKQRQRVYQRRGNAELNICLSGKNVGDWMAVLVDRASVECRSYFGQAYGCRTVSGD